MYCKGNYTAVLGNQYPGGEGYELWYIAGVTSHCEMRKGGDILYLPFYDIALLLGCTLTFLIPYGLVMGWASFALKREAYLQFRSELISQPSSIQAARSWAILSLCAGGVALLISLYKIGLYLVNW